MSIVIYVASLGHVLFDQGNQSLRVSVGDNLQNTFGPIFFDDPEHRDGLFPGVFLVFLPFSHGRTSIYVDIDIAIKASSGNGGLEIWGVAGQNSRANFSEIVIALDDSIFGHLLPQVPLHQMHRHVQTEPIQKKQMPRKLYVTPLEH